VHLYFIVSDMDINENPSTSTILDDQVKEATELLTDQIESDVQMDPIEERETREALYTSELLEEKKARWRSQESCW